MPTRLSVDDTVRNCQQGLINVDAQLLHHWRFTLDAGSHGKSGQSVMRASPRKHVVGIVQNLGSGSEQEEGEDGNCDQQDDEECCENYDDIYDLGVLKAVKITHCALVRPKGTCFVRKNNKGRIKSLVLK